MCSVFHCKRLHFEHLKTIPTLRFVSQQSKSQYINKLHALELFFYQHGQEVPSLLWNPISVSQELALVHYPEPDESTHHPICLRIISQLLSHLFLNHTSVHLLSEFLAWVFFVFLVYHAFWVLCPSYPAFEHRNCILHPSSVLNKILLTSVNLPQLGLPNNVLVLYVLYDRSLFAFLISVMGASSHLPNAVWCSTVSVVTRLWARFFKYCGSIPGKGKRFLCKVSTLSLGQTHHPVQ
jgi:hypothetical protein